jgi:hypothetical protein
MPYFAGGAKANVDAIGGACSFHSCQGHWRGYEVPTEDCCANGFIAVRTFCVNVGVFFDAGLHPHGAGCWTAHIATPGPAAIVFGAGLFASKAAQIRCYHWRGQGKAQIRVGAAIVYYAGACGQADQSRAAHLRQALGNTAFNGDIAHGFCAAKPSRGSVIVIHF